MRTVSNPNHPGNDWYEELCALAAIGELSSPEFEELRTHLAVCGDCRQLYAEFRRVAAKDLGLVAAMKESDLARDEEGALVDENAFLARLLEKAGREQAEHREEHSTAQPPQERRPALAFLHPLLTWLRRPALSYGSLGFILCALAAVGAYRLKEAQVAPTLDSLSSAVSEWKNRARSNEAEGKSTAQLLEQSEAERERLSRLLGDAQTKYAELQNQQKALEAELSAERARLDQRTLELEIARNSAEDKNKEVAQLEARIQMAARRTEEQRKLAEDLQSRLQYAQQEETQLQAANTPEAQGFSDAEAKELFGARDLHIVDVYDVDTRGNTRRSYGRVYYVEKKLLIFYAFDLQDKKHNRAAAGFQAWGYRQPSDSQPQSLGLFDADDTSANRWVLRVNNPRVLERIDAVFVTLEPPNGSPSPRGRRLLYANLAGPANHP